MVALSGVKGKGYCKARLAGAEEEERCNDCCMRAMFSCMYVCLLPELVWTLRVRRELQLEVKNPMK